MGFYAGRPGQDFNPHYVFKNFSNAQKNLNDLALDTYVAIHYGEVTLDKDNKISFSQEYLDNKLEDEEYGICDGIIYRVDFENDKKVLTPIKSASASEITVRAMQIAINEAMLANASVGKTSYIGANGNWYQWSAKENKFIDSGFKARGPAGPGYTLTTADKTELVDAVVAALPVYGGEAVMA